MTPQHPCPRQAATFRGGYPVKTSCDHRPASRGPGVDDPIGQPERDVDPVRAHTHDEDERDDQDVEGEGQHDIHDPHHDRVDATAEVAAHRADEHAETEGKEHCEHADLQVGAPGVQKAGPDVTTDLVGPEPVGPARACERVKQVL